MKQAGRAHWLILAGVASVIAVVVLFLFAKDSTTDTAGAFLRALGKGDVDTLVDLSFYDQASKEELREKWDFAVNRAGPHYIFAWKLVGSVQSDEETAAVSVMFVRDYDKGGYEQKLQIPLVKREGRWLVDVRAIDRSVYPALPR
jgi:hypothetical protein